MGKIIDLITGRNGIVRGAEVKTVSEGRVTKLKKPLELMYSLEIRGLGSFHYSGKPQPKVN